MSGLFKKGDKIVCLSGVPKFGYADTIVFIDVGREFEILTSDFIGDVVEAVLPEVFNAALNIACELAAQGRENRKVGTINYGMAKLIVDFHEIRITVQM